MNLLPKGNKNGFTKLFDFSALIVLDRNGMLLNFLLLLCLTYTP